MVEKKEFTDLLKNHIEKATGCTEIGIVALACSRCAEELDEDVIKIDITVSTNIYKNAVNVIIPGTNMRGIAMACALGAFTKRSDVKLAVLDHISPEIINMAKKLIENNAIEIHHTGTSDPIYVNAKVSDGKDEVTVIIEQGHSNIVQVLKNGKSVYQQDIDQSKKQTVQPSLLDQPLKYWIEYIESLSPVDLDFLLDAAELNYAAAINDMDNPQMTLGPSLKLSFTPTDLNCSAICAARRLTGAASEARMMGMQVPIMTITGSGNHGITNFLGIYAMAKSLEVNDEKLIKSLAITSVTTIYIKEFTSKLTAFCGCAIAPATGIAASGVYLLGGDYSDMENAMQSVIGTFAGMLCDGAKESCAFKVSTVSSAAVQFAYLAMNGAFVPKNNGIVGNTIEETFENLGILNKPGMEKTDEIVIGLIEKNLKASKQAVSC